MEEAKEEERRIEVRRIFSLYDEEHPSAQRIRCRNYLDFLKSLTKELTVTYPIYNKIAQFSSFKWIVLTIIIFNLIRLMFLLIRQEYGKGTYLGIFVNELVYLFILMWSYLQILNKDSQGIRWYEDENKSCGQLSDLECFTLSTYKITSLLGAICLGFEVLFDLLHYKDRIGEEIIWYILYIIIFLIHFQFDTFLAKPMEFVTVIFVVILLIFSYPIYGCIYYSDNKRIAQKREERRLTRVRLGYEAPRPGEENIPEFRPNIMSIYIYPVPMFRCGTYRR